MDLTLLSLSIKVSEFSLSLFNLRSCTLDAKSCLSPYGDVHRAALQTCASVCAHCNEYIITGRD